MKCAPGAVLLTALLVMITPVMALDTEIEGLGLEGIYKGEVFSRLRGEPGSSAAGDFRGQFELGAFFELDALGFGTGSVLQAMFQHAHGQGISERHVGDAQVLSNIDAREMTQISELFLEQSVSGRALLKLGKQDANADFCAVDHGALFLNSSFGVIPTVPLPTYPDPALGAAAMVAAAHWLDLGVGLYDGEPDGGASGFATAFDGQGGAVMLTQATVHAHLDHAQTLTGTYRAGFWRHETPHEHLDAAGSSTSNHGFYLACDQVLWRESGDEDPGQGMAMFAQFGWSPEERNEVHRYLGAGLIYRGLLPGREGDTLGLAAASAGFSGMIHGDGVLVDETAVEIFYQARVHEHMSIQPDLQFIAAPGGSGRDALALGLRVELTY